jgi:chaperone BCS1
MFATYALPVLFHGVQTCLLRYAASVEIMFQDTLYGQTMDWISKHEYLSHTGHSIAGTRTNYNSPWQMKDEGKGDEAEYPHLGKDSWPQSSQDKQSFWQLFRYWNKREPIRYTPQKDYFHIFCYKGRFFAIRRKSIAKQDSFYAFMENIIFLTAPWNRQLLTALIEEIQRKGLESQSNHISLYRGMKTANYEWVCIASKLRRPLDSVVLDPLQKSEFEKDVEDFLHPSTAQWYAEHYKNYRRGYLFYGPPGTGKSSLCLAMATFFGLDIYVFSFSLDENGLALLFQGLPRRCVVLLEDIDIAGVPQRPNDLNVLPSEICGDECLPEPQNGAFSRNGSITLSFLLNELDGVSAKEGRIVIMTTNRRDKLDSALIREGRIDMEVEFSLASSFVVRNLFLTFYATGNATGNHFDIGNGDELSKKDAVYAKDKIYILSIEFARHVPGGEFTHAEIQNYLFRHRKDPVSAVAKAREWTKSKLAVRECH